MSFKPLLLERRTGLFLLIFFFAQCILPNSESFSAAAATKMLTPQERQVYLEKKPVTPEVRTIIEVPPVVLEGNTDIGVAGWITDTRRKPLEGVRVSLLGDGGAGVFSQNDGSFALPFSISNDSLLQASRPGLLPRYFTPAPYGGANSTNPLSIIMEKERPIAPQPEALLLEADTIAYDTKTAALTAHGAVVASHPKTAGKLKAQRLALSSASGIVEGSGSVEIFSQNDTLHGEKFSLNTTTLIGGVENASVFLTDGNYYINSAVIQKTGNASYRALGGARVTTCDGECPDWYIETSKAGVTLDGYGYAQHATFYADGIPFFYLPYVIFPAKKTRQTGLLAPHFTISNSRLGSGVELPFYIALSPNTDATIYHRQMSKRGNKEGVEFRYAFTEDSYGTFYGDYFNDNNASRNQDAKLGATSGKRWSLYYNHYSALGEGTHLRADIVRVSDRWYFKDFSSSNYYLANRDKGGGDKFRKVPFTGDEALTALDSTVRITKNDDRYGITALFKYTEDLTQDNDSAALQKYPEIKASIAKQRIEKSPLFFNMENTLGHYRQYGGEVSGYAGDFNPTLSLPLQFDYFLLYPNLGVQTTLWRGNNGTAGEVTGSRVSVKTSASALTELSRVYDFDFLGIEKIKHFIRPEITYTYREDYYGNSNDLPAYLPASTPLNMLSLGLVTEVIARETDQQQKKQYRRFLYAKLHQTFNLTEAVCAGETSAKHLPGALLLEMDFNPYRYLSFSLRDSLSTSNGTFRAENYEMRLQSYRGDSAHVSYRYDEANKMREVYYGLGLIINPRAALTFDRRRDIRNNRDVETSVSFIYKKDCWDFVLAYNEKTSLDAYGAESSDRSVRFIVNLRGLGGWGF